VRQDDWKIFAHAKTRSPLDSWMATFGFVDGLTVGIRARMRLCLFAVGFLFQLASSHFDMACRSLRRVAPKHRGRILTRSRYSWERVGTIGNKTLSIENHDDVVGRESFRVFH